MKGAVSLGLTALDPLGTLVVADRTSALSASYYDKLAAAVKLATLLQTVSVSTSIPARLSDLAGCSVSNGISDLGLGGVGPATYGYVHPNQTRIHGFHGADVDR